MHHEVISSVRPDSHRFHANSEAGVLVRRMLELIGNGDMKKGREFLSSRGKHMTEAEFYIGLSFQWKRERVTGVDGSKLSFVCLSPIWVKVAKEENNEQKGSALRQGEQRGAGEG